MSVGKKGTPQKFATHGIRLRISQTGHGNALLCGDFLGGTMTNEKGLSTPLERNRLALRNIAQLHFDLGHGQHISRGAHRRNELCHDGLGAIRSYHAGACKVECQYRDGLAE